MSTSAYEAAVLLRRWNAAKADGNPVIAIIEKTPTPDPTDHWTAFAQFEDAKVPQKLLPYITRIQLVHLPHERCQTMVSLRHETRTSSIIAADGMASTMNLMLDDNDTCDVTRGIINRYGENAAHVWLKSGGTRMAALTNPPDVTAVACHEGLLRLTMRGGLSPHPTQVTCRHAFSHEEWQDSLTYGIGQLAATLGHAPLRPEITEILRENRRLPAGAGWARELLTKGNVLLNVHRITSDGRLYLPVEYEHAQYRDGMFHLKTGRWDRRGSNAPDSVTYRMLTSYVVRTTRRDSSGEIKDQWITIGPRVPKKAATWLRESGYFPSSKNPVSPNFHGGGLGPGKMNPPTFRER